MSRKLLIAFLCMSMVFTMFLPAAYADDSAVASGTFTADASQANDEAWNILASSPEKPHEFGAWMNKAEEQGNGEYTIGSGKYNGADTPDYWVVTGGAPEGSEIKTFVIRARDKKYVQILGSSELEGTYTEVELLSDEADTENVCTNAYTPKRLLTYNMEGLGYRFVKIQSLATDWGGALLGKYSYTYDLLKADEPVAQSGSFKANIYSSTDAGWNIVASSKPYQAYSFSNWISAADKGGNGEWNIGSDKYDGEDTPSYWVVTGGVPEGTEIQTFEVHAKTASCLRVWGSSTIDGEYTELFGDSGKDDGAYPSTSPYAPKMAYRYRMFRNGYKYIKIESTASSWSNAIFGIWSYTYGVPDYYENDVNISASGSTCTLTNVITPTHSELDTVKLKAFCTVYDKDGKLLYMDMIEHEIGTTPWSLEFTNVPYDADYTVQLVYINNEEGFKFPLSPNLSATAQN